MESLKIHNENEGPKHISERSPEYLIHQLQNSERISGPEGRVFGGFHFKIIEIYRQAIEEMETEDLEQVDMDIAEYEKKIAEQISGFRIELRQMNQDNIVSYYRFFNEMTNDSTLDQDLEPFRQMYETDKFEFNVLLGAVFKVTDLPDKLLEKMLNIHVHNFMEQEAQLKEQEPILKARFLKDAQEAIEKGILPVESRSLHERLGNISLNLIDPAVSARFGCVEGRYVPSSNEIGINSSIPPEKRYGVFAHESIHALAGRTLLFDPNRPAYAGKIAHQKNGLSIGGTRKVGRKFSWLDEAVTEDLSARISTGKVTSYHLEIENLQHLIDLGMPRELILNAYFENYDPENPERVPEWKKFIAKINELLPNGVADFVRTDKDVAEEKAKRLEKIQEGVIKEKISAQW